MFLDDGTLVGRIGVANPAVCHSVSLTITFFVECSNPFDSVRQIMCGDEHAVLYRIMNTHSWS